MTPAKSFKCIRQVFNLSLVTLVTGVIYGQSLYSEACELKELLYHPSHPQLEISDTGSRRINVDGQRIKLTDKIYEMASYDRFTISKVKNFDRADSITIIYQTDTSHIAVDSVIQIDNLPNRVAWTTTSSRQIFDFRDPIILKSTRLTREGTLQIDTGSLPSRARTIVGDSLHITSPGFYSIRSDDTVTLIMGDDSLTYAVLAPEKLKLTKTNTNVILQMKMDFQGQHIIKKDYYRLIGLLSLHNDFLDTLRDLTTLKQTYEAYQNNSFLKPGLEHILYSYQLNSELRLMDFDTELFSAEISKNLHDNYSWIPEMYGLEKKSSLEASADKDQKYYEQIVPAEKSAGLELSLQSETANTQINKALGLDVTTLIAGLSDFIVERAQEELSITFLDRFQRYLNDPDHPEYKTLFPETSKVFLQFDISNYKNLLKDARSSFKTDLQNLGWNLPQLLNLDKYAINNKFSKDIYNIALFFQIVNLVYQDRSIDEILVGTYQYLDRRQLDFTELINLDIANQLDSQSFKNDRDTGQEYYGICPIIAI
ncbi:MAG: hypothetical protein IPL46_01975 [Saprospiraceae bacterium]|nr:hypothetical protein [Saprospiraceae bacterium]